jgi:single-stranded DNA-binding protein
MMHARGLVVLTADPVERATRDGRPFATAAAVVPALDDGASPIRLNLVAFDALAPALLALAAGALVVVHGTLALTTWTGKDGSRRETLRLTLRTLDAPDAGTPRLAAIARATGAPHARTAPEDAR